MALTLPLPTPCCVLQVHFLVASCQSRPCVLFLCGAFYFSSKFFCKYPTLFLLGFWCEVCRLRSWRKTFHWFQRLLKERVPWSWLPFWLGCLVENPLVKVQLFSCLLCFANSSHAVLGSFFSVASQADCSSRLLDWCRLNFPNDSFEALWCKS